VRTVCVHEGSGTTRSGLTASGSPLTLTTSAQDWSPAVARGMHQRVLSALSPRQFQSQPSNSSYSHVRSIFLLFLSLSAVEDVVHNAHRVALPYIRRRR